MIEMTKKLSLSVMKNVQIIAPEAMGVSNLGGEGGEEWA